jgi:hypothetical protein
MRSGEVFPSKYLKAEDIEQDSAVVIESVKLEKFTDPQTKKETEKPVMYLVDVDKPVILNKTNWALIAKQYGDESDEWAGKRITLTVVDVEAFGDVVQAIRVKPAAKPRIGGKPAGKGLRPASEEEAANQAADDPPVNF